MFRGEGRGAADVAAMALAVSPGSPQGGEARAGRIASSIALAPIAPPEEMRWGT